MRFGTIGEMIDSILLVDDDPITNFLNENLLSEMNVAREVHTTTDGQEALDFIKQNWKEERTGANRLQRLVLLDLNMPIMSGFEFMDELNKMNQFDKVTIVLLTTSSNRKDIEKVGNYAVHDYVLKPLSTAKINKIVASLEL